MLFGRSKSYLFQAWVQNELQEASWVDFGSLLEGFGRVLTRFGEELGRILEGFGHFCTGCGQIVDVFGNMWPCWGRVSK